MRDKQKQIPPNRVRSTAGRLMAEKQTQPPRGLLAIEFGLDVLFEHGPVLAVECVLEILAEFVERGVEFTVLEEVIETPWEPADGGEAPSAGTSVMRYCRTEAGAWVAEDGGES